MKRNGAAVPDKRLSGERREIGKDWLLGKRQRQKSTEELCGVM
nr:hypothetical protein [uncultured Acetatifactor sp.]